MFGFKAGGAGVGGEFLDMLVGGDDDAVDTPAQTRAKGRHLWNPFVARAGLDAARPFRSTERKMLGWRLSVKLSVKTLKQLGNIVAS